MWIIVNSNTLFILNRTLNRYMRDRLALEGAIVTVAGTVWDETNEKALAFAASSNQHAYIPPFDHPDIWEGHATVVEELAEQLPQPPDLVIVSVGGGGYFSGVCQGLKQVGWDKTTRVLAMETHGANSLGRSVEAKKLVTLDRIWELCESQIEL